MERVGRLSLPPPRPLSPLISSYPGGRWTTTENSPSLPGTAAMGTVSTQRVKEPQRWTCELRKRGEPEAWVSKGGGSGGRFTPHICAEHGSAASGGGGVGGKGACARHAAARPSPASRQGRRPTPLSLCSLSCSTSRTACPPNRHVNLVGTNMDCAVGGGAAMLVAGRGGARERARPPSLSSG